MASVPNIVCPNCQKMFKGKPELIGKTIRCPGCHETFVFKPPQQAEGSDALAAAAEKKADASQAETFSFQEGPPPQPSTGLDEEESGAYGVTELDTTPRCPNCANELESEDAVVCLFCGYNLATRKWGKTKKVYGLSTSDYIMHLLPGVLCVMLIIGQVIGALWYCVVFPNIAGGFWTFFDAEATRVWVVIFGLFDMWALGIFAYKRLVVQPAPEEVEKSK